MLHIVRPDEQVIDHLDVLVDAAGYLVLAVCVSVTAGQPSLRRHLISVPAPGSDKRKVMIVVRMNWYAVESIPGIHG